MTSTVQFGYWGKAQKAGITPNLLLNLLKVQETTGLSTQPKLEPHPTFGILIELLEYAVELESLYQGISTKSVLKMDWLSLSSLLIVPGKSSWKNYQKHSPASPTYSFQQYKEFWISKQKMET